MPRMLPADLQRLTDQITPAYCPPECGVVVGYHGTSLKRAQSILKHGFADSTTLAHSMLEGYSSQEYEGGLTFFGKNSHDGIKLASRHALDTAFNEYFAETPSRSWKTFDFAIDAPPAVKRAALVKSTICACNYLRDRDVTPDLMREVQKYAESLGVHSRELKKTNRLWRFTYALKGEGSAFDFLDTGVMTSYRINMRDVMHDLGFDLTDGYEENVSLALPTPRHRCQACASGPRVPSDSTVTRPVRSVGAW